MSDELDERERAANMVHSDPEIMAGTPVFRGTRVAVYQIADMIEQGTPIQEILEGYPSLTRSMAGVCSYLRRNASETRQSTCAALVRDKDG